ncbi:MAG: hypothetical protein AAF570_13780, partial [Bacteroidota bacterium]
VGFRRQSSFILSAYRQYLQEGGHEDFNYLFNLENTGIIKKEELFFSERIRTLKRLFSRVFVYSQESLRSRPQDLVDALHAFLEVPQSSDLQVLPENRAVNASVKSRFQVRMLRRLNQLNRQVSRIPMVPSMYGRLFRKLRITPRDISQHYLKHVGKAAFTIDQGTRTFLEEHYAQDWEAVRLAVSY